jgi:hypothetical protein
MKVRSVLEQILREFHLCFGRESNTVFNSWFSELLHPVVWWSDTNVSENNAASIFKAEAQHY